MRCRKPSGSLIALVLVLRVLRPLRQARCSSMGIRWISRQLGEQQFGVFRSTCFALDQQHVASGLVAVTDPVAHRAALHAGAHHIISDPLCQPFIEHEVLAFVLAGQTSMP
jgi:hypothetical protein